MIKVVSAIAVATLAVLTAACAPTVAAQGSAVANQSILSRSIPVNGSTVAGPVNQLDLWFNPRARLGKVTVMGPGGTMPMMVTAVGEVTHYSLPLSGLENGNYTVNWTATAAGSEYRGSFGFIVH